MKIKKNVGPKIDTRGKAHLLHPVNMPIKFRTPLIPLI